jgi:DNA primase
MDNNIKRKIIEEALGKGNIGKDGINFSVACPFCKERKSGKLKFSIRLDDSRYHCWVCETKGKNIWFLISKIRPDLHDRISGFLNNNFKTNHQSITQKENLDLPDGLIPLWKKNKQPDVLACQNYLRKRNISENDIIRYRIMAGTSGLLRRHVFFPSFDSEGKLNYYIARNIDESNFKYKNAGVAKTSIIFNEIDIDWNSKIILVEGIFDAVSVGFNAIPVLGSTVPKNSALWDKLVYNLCDVTIAFDADLPQKAYTLAKDLYSAGCKVSLAFPPQGFKDWSEMPRDLVNNFIENSRIHDEFDLIYYKINNIRSGSII